MFSEWIDAAEHDYYCSDCGNPAARPGTGATCIATGRCKECRWQTSDTRLCTEWAVWKAASDVWLAYGTENEYGGEVVLYRRENDDQGEVFIHGLIPSQIRAFIHDCEAAVMRNDKRFDARQWKADNVTGEPPVTED